MDWIGFIDDQERSLKLLKQQLDLDTTIDFELPFKNKHNYDKSITSHLSNKLKKLLARDIYIYNFAKRLFEARIYASKTGIYITPQREFFDRHIFEYSNKFYQKVLNKISF